MKHKCIECGKYRYFENMTKVPRKDKYPLYKCVKCNDTSTGRWLEFPRKNCGKSRLGVTL